MARISDIIAQFINDMIEDEKDKEVMIQRNELADQFRCAPSQINYVLTTRFTHEKGYVIESRRGGGGYIVIKQVSYDGTERGNRIIYDAVGTSITYHNAVLLLENLLEMKIINSREIEIMKMAVNDRTLSDVENRNEIRANILKSMLMVVLC